ncbi:MAG: hypothetical protein IPK67_16320 [Planctomycetes bacterium]|nr:hypothetical protein [Planctomycetota bacterium]
MPTAITAAANAQEARRDGDEHRAGAALAAPGHDGPRDGVEEREPHGEEARLGLAGQEAHGHRQAQSRQGPGRGQAVGVEVLEGQLDEVQAGRQGRRRRRMGIAQEQHVVAAEGEGHAAQEGRDAVEPELAQEEIGEAPQDQQLQGRREQQRRFERQHVERQAEGREHGGLAVGEVRRAAPVVGVPQGQTTRGELLLVEQEPRLHLHRQVGEQLVRRNVPLSDPRQAVGLGDVRRRVIGGRVPPQGGQEEGPQHQARRGDQGPTPQAGSRHAAATPSPSGRRA